MVRFAAKIPDWPEDERPRERLLKHGPDSLADAELLAIILGTGSGQNTSVDLARHLLSRFDGLRGIDVQPAETLCEINGIGIAKAAGIKAALELAKRLAQQRWRVREGVTCSQDVYRLFHLRMRDLGREEFRALFLTGRNVILSEKILFEGSLRESVVSPREIILSAVQLSAASVILLHNHPSGDPFPSSEDKVVTRKIAQACEYVDISVLDHIIIGKDSYYSFADHGLMDGSFSSGFESM
jgi:DNA repair protein RadC